MAAQVSKQDTAVSIQNGSEASQTFALVQQISSKINKDYIQEIIDRVQDHATEDNQLVVDLLSIVLEKSHHLLKYADRVLLLLTKIVSCAQVFARNRTINSEHFTFGGEQSPDILKMLGEPHNHLRVVKRGDKNASTAINERFITWAHLSHPNILSVYAAFLEGINGPISLVSPIVTERNFVNHAKTLPQASRMLLISDVISGLCYLHRLNIPHGRLIPQSLCIYNERRPCITDLDAVLEEDSDETTIRYSAPELLKDDDPVPTLATDMWSLGCIIYEVLSGKVPFYQHRQERKALVAIVTGNHPTRPGPEEPGVSEIDDHVWRPLSTCWESQPEDRPRCMQFEKAFLNTIIHDDRPSMSSIIQPEALEFAKAPPSNFDRARSILSQFFGSDPSISSPSQIPERLQNPLFTLADNVSKADAIAVAAQKLNHDDVQTLVDVLDTIWEEYPSTPIFSSPIDRLHSGIVISTRKFPQRYKIDYIRYDPAPTAEADWGTIHKGRDFDVCVSVVTQPGVISHVLRFLGSWVHSLHPNILPLYGVFYEVENDIPQLRLVTPYGRNGLLCDYARSLPQKNRALLISDVISGLVHLQGLNFGCCNIRGDTILISDEGRAFIDADVRDLCDTLTSTASAEAIPRSGPYAFRFHAPERVRVGIRDVEATVWSFGCLVYEVLTRKVPFHQYAEETEIQSALSRGEAPQRPSVTDVDIDYVTDQFWDLIMGCCASNPRYRLTLVAIQKRLADMGIEDDRPKGAGFPGAEVLALRSPPDINWDAVERILDQIQIELLRSPLSKLLQNRTADVAGAVTRLHPEDTRTLVDFLDVALKNHITLPDERNRVLALLSRITTSTHIFPQRYELKGIKYQSSSFAGGGFGAVHRGISDPDVCVKVMAKVDSKALMDFVKELILWAHSSHPNVLPFYGVFVDGHQRLCLVSPFMKKGNLHDYAPGLAQKDRIPFLHDVIKGLIYLHGLGIIHTDLKGENVLISDDGRGLITDFGASRVITATAKGEATTAAVASTLRFTAPEIVLNRHSRPTQECDIWSFGCLCFEILSCKLPYFEYSLETQIFAALSRKQPPKRPNSANDNSDDEGWDEFDELDWDEIDGTSWSLIMHCCAPEPEDRPNASRIEELLVDLNLWDYRPEAKDTRDIFRLKLSPDLELNRVGELLNELQTRFFAQMILQYPIEIVVRMVEELDLDENDRTAIVNFWDLVFRDQLFTPGQGNLSLALLSALIGCTGTVPWSYVLSTDIEYNRSSIGSGSFGLVYPGIDPGLCIKMSYFWNMDLTLNKQWNKALAPFMYSSHPNVLPCYGAYLKDSSHGDLGFLFSPFMKDGNFHNALRLPRKSRILLICDVIEAVMYLHDLGIVHGNLKGENILISDEGRAFVADFRPYHVNAAAAEDGPIGPHMTSTLRFTAPELVKNNQILPSTKSDIWSIGCIIYLLFSRKVPFYQYSQDAEIRSALSGGELLVRPVPTDNDAGEIDDSSWDLIMKCCAPEPDDRLSLPGIRRWFTNLGIKDNRPPASPLPGAEILKLRNPHPGVDVERIGDILARIKSRIPQVAQDGGSEHEIQN